jgi:hypothetical protein
MFELMLGVAFVASLVAVGIGAATSATGSALVVFEAGCLFAIGLVVVLELLPGVVALRASRAALRRLRQELDELPETPHPLDPAARQRSDQSD